MPAQPLPAGVGGDVPGATSDPREEILVRFSQGHIVTNHAFKFFSVTAKLFTLDNTPDGYYEAEYQLTTPLADIVDRPAKPVPPYDTPVGPVEHTSVNAQTKGRWTFADGSSLSAIGNGNFHALRTAPGPKGSVMLWLTADQIITGGTGIYEGAQGLKILSGSAELAGDFQKGKGLFAFVGRTVDCFRVVRGQYIYRPPAA